MASADQLITRSIFDFGYTTEIMPIAAIPERTTNVKAGRLSIGIEYRWLSDEIVASNFADNPEVAALIEDVGMENLDDSGVCLHICDAQTGDEYLRFDCFDKEPHYHYIRPHKDNNTTVELDPHATGDTLAFALRCLRTRLRPMLEYAEASGLAQAVDESAVEAALPEVESIARELVEANAKVSN